MELELESYKEKRWTVNRNCCVKMALALFKHQIEHEAGKVYINLSDDCWDKKLVRIKYCPFCGEKIEVIQ